MPQSYGKISANLKKSFSDPRRKRSIQSSLGITIFTLFVLSSVMVSRSVQALNQAAGNYGYYSGSYGYQASQTTSDQVPSAPTSLSTSNQQQTSITVSWTAPTTTTLGTAIATGDGSISTYLIHYSTSAQSACSGGTSTTSTSASVALSSLTAGTTYNVAVCARDNNLNDSSALTGSFTTQSSGGGTAATTGSTGGGGATGPTFPTSAPAAPATPAAPAAPAVTPAVAALPATVTKVQESARELTGADLPVATASAAAQFVAGSGVPAAVAAFGAGELNAIVRDVIQITKTFSLANAIAIASGQKPPERNLGAEKKQLPEVLAAFVKLTGHRPNFKDPKQDLAWNTLQYRVRFKRDLAKEKSGIVKFKAIYKRNPKSPLDWSVVRAWGYALR